MQPFCGHAGARWLAEQRFAIDAHSTGILIPRDMCVPPIHSQSPSSAAHPRTLSRVCVCVCVCLPNLPGAAPPIAYFTPAATRAPHIHEHTTLFASRTANIIINLQQLNIIRKYCAAACVCSVNIFSFCMHRRAPRSCAAFNIHIYLQRHFSGTPMDAIVQSAR